MQREKQAKQNTPELQDSIKTVIPGGGERKDGTEGISELVMSENFPKLLTDTNPQIQEAQNTPCKRNIERKPVPKHIHI